MTALASQKRKGKLIGGRFEVPFPNYKKGKDKDRKLHRAYTSPSCVLD